MQPVFAPPWLEGPARFHVGLKPIATETWLTPDDQAAWLPGKAALLDQMPGEVFRQEPGSEPGQAEALEMVCTALGQPVPTGPEPDLLAASRLVSDDLVLLQAGEADRWRVTALSLCAPTFFSAAHAIGGDLGFLHGPVPGGDPGLAGRIGRVFAGLQPGVVLERHNWTVQWSDARHTPTGAPLREAAAAAPVDQAPDMLFERVERQTIRKLPASGAVVFTIRIRLMRLQDRLREPAHAAAFRKAWAGSAPEVRAYKRWAPLERHVAALLQASGA